MDNQNYFARIPYSLFSALEKNEINGCEFLAMSWFYKWADWSTGIVRKVTAARLVWATAGSYSDRTFQRAVHRLHEVGLIVSSGKQGSRKPYQVVINNYLALSGTNKDAMINVAESKSCDGSQNNFDGDACEVNGEVDGQVDGQVDSLHLANTTRLGSDFESDSSSDSSRESLKDSGAGPAAADSPTKTKSTPPATPKDSVRVPLPPGLSRVQYEQLIEQEMSREE